MEGIKIQEVGYREKVEKRSGVIKMTNMIQGKRKIKISLERIGGIGCETNTNEPRQRICQIFNVCSSFQCTERTNKFSQRRLVKPSKIEYRLVKRITVYCICRDKSETETFIDSE